MDLDFKIARYLLHFEPIDTVCLPAYKGSTIRGAFGHALKSVCCTFQDQECADCLLRRTCLFQLAFGSRPQDGGDTLFASYNEVPRPFIIEPPLEDNLTYRPGDRILLGLILMGQAIEQVPLFIAAFRKMGEDGLGKGRGRLRLTRVTLADQLEKVVFDGVEFVPCPVSISLKQLLEKVLGIYRQWDKVDIAIKVQTPLRLKEKGQLKTQVSPTDLVKTVLRRTTGLGTFYGSGELGRETVHDLLTLAGQITIGEQDLYWYDWSRMSMRHGPMKLGGLMGNIQLKDVPTGLLPWLVAGEILHIGKGATFGLGKYRITELRG